MVDRRFVLLEFGIRKECIFVIAQEFLGRNPDTIRFSPHRRSLTAEASSGKIVTEKKDAIGVISHKRSGDPLHFYDSIFHCVDL
ncbi:MAG TPA: hypothetical protein PKC65_01940 [Pyrinomonadaceae bacterium]|nr:hypothetical protein [Pyrinomonadaceae bacterium]